MEMASPQCFVILSHDKIYQSSSKLIVGISNDSILVINLTQSFRKCSFLIAFSQSLEMILFSSLIIWSITHQYSRSGQNYFLLSWHNSFLILGDELHRVAWQLYRANTYIASLITDRLSTLNCKSRWKVNCHLVFSYKIKVLEKLFRSMLHCKYVAKFQRLQNSQNLNLQIFKLS